MNYISLVFLLTLVGAMAMPYAKAQEPTQSKDRLIHIESGDGDISKRAVTLEMLQKLITNAEVSTKRHGEENRSTPDDPFVSDRIIINDSCMGSDQYEHDNLAEGSIICLLAISKEQKELPLVKVYFAGEDGKNFDLLQLAILPAELVKKLHSDEILGKHIWASLYWIPKVRTLRGKVLVDFASNRVKFGTGITLPFPANFGQGLIDRKAKELTVNLGTMKEVIEREYPGFELLPSIKESIQSLRKPS